MTKKRADLNNLSDFHSWIRENFNWIDPRVKKLMKRAWCARGVYYRKLEKK